MAAAEVTGRATIIGHAVSFAGLILALLAIAGSVAPAEASAAISHSRKPLCVRRRCRTLATSTHVRVFQATERSHQREEAFQSTYARWLPTDRVTAFGDYAGESILPSVNLGPFALSGEHVAYALDGGDGGYGFSVDYWHIYRLNAKTGGKFSVCAYLAQACEGYDRPGPPLPGVTVVVVTPAGSIGWITSGREEATASTFSVYELPAGSKTAKALASGTSIARKSLRARAGRLYWADAEGTQSKPIS
jgi:hypothetical protein